MWRVVCGTYSVEMVTGSSIELLWVSESTLPSLDTLLMPLPSLSL